MKTIATNKAVLIIKLMATLCHQPQKKLYSYLETPRFFTNTKTES